MADVIAEAKRRAGRQDWHSLVKHRDPHAQQRRFIESTALQRIIRAGRRGGKTVGAGIIAEQSFMQGKRVLYATPTSDQLDTFWYEVNWSLHDAIEAGHIKKNESRHTIEVPGTKNRIRAKTAWNADTLRGDYGDIIILDEFQLMSEDILESVVFPMLMDNSGTLILIYTPPSTSSRSVTKARDPRHAAKLFKAVENGEKPGWEAFHFRSEDNPDMTPDKIARMAQNMTRESYRREILAEDPESVPGALLTQAIFDQTRVTSHPDLFRIVVGVDPAGSSSPNSDETGIVVCGVARHGKELHGYTLADFTLRGTPDEWAGAVFRAFNQYQADLIIAEKNNGGEMVKSTIQSKNANLPVKLVHASRGKATRAEPIAIRFENGAIHHVGDFPELEDQWCGYVPGIGDSPDRLDAEVWCYTELMPVGNGDVELTNAPDFLANWRG